MLIAATAVAAASPAGAAGLAARGLSSARFSRSGGAAPALLSYLRKIDQARRPYLKAGPAVEAALNKLSNTPDATWTTAARKAEAAQRAATKLAAAVGSITPPPNLKQANQQFRRSGQLAAQFLGQLAVGLSARDVTAVKAVIAGFPKVRDRIHALEKAWQVAVTAAAGKARVALPSWVATLGNS